MSNAMNSVAIARMIERPNTKQFIKAIFDDFMEFHGDHLRKHTILNSLTQYSLVKTLM